MSSTWGNNIKISIFGESHGEAIGVVIDGLPSGEEVNFDEIMIQMQRRTPGGDFVSKRCENDIPEMLSGIFNNKTTGTPLCAIINNKDAKSADYNQFLPRPGHADYTGHVRYKGFNDFRGGGHFSGRLTCPLVFAGAICRQILKKRNIEIIADIIDKDKLQARIVNAKSNGDSVGGIIECTIIGVPAGVGNPIFDNIESKISSMVFGIPGVKGIEFGSGFASAEMIGSEHNDEFIIEDGIIKTKTNNHGGILGGISSGMPIIFRTAFKPTSSIEKCQKTVNLKDNTEQEISTKGRHDPCIAIRAVPVVEAATAIAILDLIVNFVKED